MSSLKAGKAPVPYQASTLKRQSKESSDSSTSSVPKKLRSKPLNSDGQDCIMAHRDLDKHNTATSRTLHRSCDNCHRSDSRDLRTLNKQAGNENAEIPAPRQFLTISPSSISSPLLSQRSSTMIFSVYGVPEDMEVHSCVLADDDALSCKERKARRTLARSPLCVEPSTTLNQTCIQESSLSVRKPGCDQMGSDITSSYDVITPVSQIEEATRFFTVKTSPIPSAPDHDCIEKQPTTFADLVGSLQRKIFGIALVRKYEILPLYRCGMLIEGPWAPVNVEDSMDPGVSVFENVDLSLLQVSKRFNEVCSEIFYGQNYFFFYHADLCRWWVQHIGIKNFSRIRSLVLGLNWGFNRPRGKGRCRFDLSQEEVWLNVLCWMQNRHRLCYLHIQIIKWDDLDWARGLTNEEMDQLSWCRRLIMYVLQRYRGIEKVEISCDESRWLTRREMQTFALLMQQPKDDVFKPQELSLFELINRLRIDREEEETREEAEEGRERGHLGYGR